MARSSWLASDSSNIRIIDECFLLNCHVNLQPGHIHIHTILNVFLLLLHSVANATSNRLGLPQLILPDHFFPLHPLIMITQCLRLTQITSLLLIIIFLLKLFHQDLIMSLIYIMHSLHCIIISRCLFLRFLQNIFQRRCHILRLLLQLTPQLLSHFTPWIRLLIFRWIHHLFIELI